MKKRWLLASVGVIVALIMAVVFSRQAMSPGNQQTGTAPIEHALTIDSIANRSYEASGLQQLRIVEETEEYNASVVAYSSDEFTIQAYMLRPTSEVPDNGYPTVVINHGLTDPAEYDSVISNQNNELLKRLVRNGYLVLVPDYRGHGDSDGQSEAELRYQQPVYTYDVLNLFSAMQDVEYIDSQRIGFIGYSLGGLVTLRALVTGVDVAASVLISAPVGTAAQLYYQWPKDNETARLAASTLESFSEEFGEPRQNPEAWRQITPINYVSDIAGPVQLHHGDADTVVPVGFTRQLSQALEDAQQPHELYIYPGSGHDIGPQISVLALRVLSFLEQEM